MAQRAKAGLVGLALGSVATMFGPALAENVTAAAAKHRTAAAELIPVGGSGLRGLAVASEHAGKLRFHATLACSQACPTGATTNGVRVRFKLAKGRCGKPPGRTFSVGGGKLTPGGLDIQRTASFDPSNDPLTYSLSVRATWDLNNDGKFEPAVIGAIAATDPLVCMI